MKDPQYSPPLVVMLVVVRLLVHSAKKTYLLLLVVFLAACTGGVIDEEEPAQWQTDASELTFVSAVNNSASARTVVVSNAGGASELMIISKPDWLNVDISRASVANGTDTSVILTPSMCASETNEQVPLILGDSQENAISIALILQCVVPSFDIALERIYFMQSTTQADSAQALPDQVPLVAGREALMRAFVSGTGSIFGVEPSVILHYETPAGDQGEIDFSGPGILPALVEEQYLIQTFNAIIPAEIVQLGTRFYISVDGEELYLEANENNNRYPAEGFRDLNVLNVPEMDIVIVPVIVNDITPDTRSAYLNSLLSATYGMMPIPSYRFEVKPAITYEGTNWQELLGIIENIQIANQETDRYYLGLASHPLAISNDGFIAGIGYIGQRTSASLNLADTVAHEFGHNFGRFHSPCGQPSGIDPNYPYEDGDLGAFGADFTRDRIMFQEGNEDIMSYCSSQWISDYTYKKIIERIGSNTALSQLQKADGISSTSSEWFTVTGYIDHNNNAIIEHVWLDNSARKEQPEFSEESDLEVIALDENANILGRRNIKLYTPDHADQERFGLSIEIDSLESLAEIHIDYNGSTLTTKTVKARNATEQIIPISGLQKETVQGAVQRSVQGTVQGTMQGSMQGSMQKLAQQEPSPQEQTLDIAAHRIDSEVVQVTWKSQKRIIIRDSKNNSIIAISNRGQTAVRTSSDLLIIEDSTGNKSYVAISVSL